MCMCVCVGCVGCVGVGVKTTGAGHGMVMSFFIYITKHQAKQAGSSSEEQITDFQLNNLNTTTTSV